EPLLLERRESGEFSDDLTGADFGDGIFHGQVDRAVDGNVSADGIVGGARGRNAFDVVREFGEAAEETSASEPIALDSRDRVMDRELERAGEDVEGSRTVLDLAHQEPARLVFLARDRAGKFLPDFLAYGGKIGDRSQLVGGEDLASQVGRQDYVFGHEEG